MTTLSLIFAISKNGVIGHEGKLPWHLPTDLQFFKKATTGHTVIMGRKTYESIGKPLPKRNNIIISRQEDFGPEGCYTVSSPDEAFALAVSLEHQIDPSIFVIGGAQIYKEFYNAADRLIITCVDCVCEGDTKLDLFSMSDFDHRWRNVGTMEQDKEILGDSHNFTTTIYNRK